MRPHKSLPFVGLLVLASLVAMLAGVGDVAERSALAPVVGEAAITAKSADLLAAPRLGRIEPAVEAFGDEGVIERGSALTGAAKPALDPGWLPAAPIKNAAGATTVCGSTWSGGNDAAGLIYHACKNSIHIRTAKGAFKETVNPGETAPVGRRDVAVNGAGTIIYYTVGDRVDTGMTPAQLSAGWGSVHRAKKNASGVWKRDTTFSVGPFRLYGGDPWSGRYLAVGSDGVVYTSVNAFVFAFDSNGRTRADENGQYNAAGARIGGPIAGYDAIAPAVGFNVVEGLATSPSGTYLYATEEDYDYAVRFVRNAAGAWTPDRIAGTPKPPTSTCTPTTLAAPYDIATATNGDVYVANTTCGEIRRYDATLTYKGSVLTLDTLPHGLALAGNGAILLPWRNEIYARK